MPNLTPVQVLTILAERLEKRANTLEAVRLSAYNITIDELRRFANMTRQATAYLAKQGKSPTPHL